MLVPLRPAVLHPQNEPESEDQRMEIEYGATVLDKNGKNIGTVDYIIRDSWSGDIKKFVIRRHPAKDDLFLAPEHVQESDKAKIKMDLPLAELEQL